MAGGRGPGWGVLSASSISAARGTPCGSALGCLGLEDRADQLLGMQMTMPGWRLYGSTPGFAARIAATVVPKRCASR